MIYLDNAATTFPKPKEVNDAVYDCMCNYCANPGRSSHKLAIKGAMTIYDAREKIAEFFNFDNPLRVIFTSNATDSLNIAIKGFLKKGDHVIISAMEHNSVLRPVHELKNKGLIDVTIIKCDKEGKIDTNDIKKAIKENTKLIAMTYVSNLTGTIFPVEEIGKIAKEYNIKYLMDASQAAGILPVDMKSMNIDLMACPAHKGLLGPEGLGVLLVGDEIDLDHNKEGGTGSESHNLSQPSFYPDKLEAGTPNLPAIAGLSAGIDYIKSKGLKSILSHENKLLDLLVAKMKNNPKIQIYGPEHICDRSGCVPINIEGKDSSEVAYILDDQFEIAVRPGKHCAPLAHETIGTKELGAVRISVGPFTTESDIIKVVDALNKISEN